jgi:calcineurin-like phosphoesterase family protein
MCKAVILNDTHFGFKGDSTTVNEYFIRFFENQLFPYIEENKIQYVFHLGDLFDRRKYINFRTLNQVRERVLDVFEKLGTENHIICGNHDTFFRNNNSLNSLTELLSKYKNWKVYSEPTMVNFGPEDKYCAALLPWINPENEQKSAEFIKDVPCSILMGHLELAGFQSIRGVFIDAGYDPSHFAKFEYVLTGHYHVSSRRDNIYYLGTQYQMSFSDVWEKKGFHVFDFKTRELQFIENPEKIFFTIDYNEDEKINLNFETYKNSFVKIFVKKRTKNNLFEKFIDKFYEVGVAELAIAEETQQEKTELDIDIEKDTLQLLYEEVNLIEEKVDKNMLHDIITTTYQTALAGDIDD